MKIVKVRREQQDDEPSVRHIIASAFAASEFGHHGEANLVDRLRVSCPNAVSLVAEIDQLLIGHILFTPVTINSDQPYPGMGLAPLSVLPEFQRKGVGTQLTLSGLEIIQRDQTAFAVVLGHPDYYQRFGFQRASKYGVTTTFDVPEEIFMIRVFDPARTEITGVARYHPEFDAS